MRRERLKNLEVGERFALNVDGGIVIGVRHPRYDDAQGFGAILADGAYTITDQEVSVLDNGEDGAILLTEHIIEDGKSVLSLPPRADIDAALALLNSIKESQ